MRVASFVPPLALCAVSLCTLLAEAPPPRAATPPGPAAPRVGGAAAAPASSPSSHQAPAAVKGGTSRRAAPARDHVPATIPAGPPPRIMPLAEVRPGMTGEALTVFQGTKPEPFKIRVVSIMRQFLPKQDVILIRVEDPRVAFSGIVSGMSGSPVYIDGRLMGAIAYAWSFSKEPFGGVTPIESMLAERSRPRRSKAELIAETTPGGIQLLTLAEGGKYAPGPPSAALAPGGGDTGQGWPARATATAMAPADERGHLVRVAVPLSVSGFDPRALTAMTDDLRTLGLVAAPSGGGRKAGAGGVMVNDVAGRVEPGSVIGVEMIRGDMGMVATGTVTYVDRQGVVAFGHPLFGVGEIYLPLVDAEIHAILPSLSQSMKLSSPRHEVGALVQDRQSGILGDLGARATMVPISVQVTGPGAAPRSFRAEVARNRRLTPMLAAVVANNALLTAEPDAADMVVSVLSKVQLKGRGAIELRDEIFTPEGVSRQGLAGTRGLRAVGDLLSNPFEPIVLERLDIDVRVEYRRDVTEIVGLALPGDVVRPGDTVSLRVSLRPYAGAEYVETIPVVIPRTLGGEVARIEAASGATARPDIPQPESLPTYLDNLRRYYSPSAIVVSVHTPSDGASLHGRLLADLPGAAADTLRPSNQTRRADAYRVIERTSFPTKHLVFGRQEISVYVGESLVKEAKTSTR